MLPRDVLAAYSEPHRYYHNVSHIEHMLRVFRRFDSRLTQDESDLLYDAILYHDFVYQVGASDNEEKSYEAFLLAKPNYSDQDKEIVKGLIMATKSPFDPKTELEKLMLFIDWSHFVEDPRKLHEVNVNIFKEFQKYPFADYVKGRDTFLKGAENIPDKFVGDFVDQATIDVLKEGIKKSQDLSVVFRPRIGIYIGSFKPLHIGHKHIIEKAEKNFDKVIIVQAVNTSKKDVTARPLPKHYDNYQTVVVDSGKAADEIIKDIVDNYADYYIIRGLRNGFDLSAEQSYMFHLKNMGVTIPILHYVCDPEFQNISSSDIRALEAVGKSMYIVE